MFEDSTFESMGRIRTRSRKWMIVTLALNATVLLGLVLIPLIYPEALPRFALAMLMEVPTTPVEEPKPVMRQERTPAAPSEIRDGSVVAPSRIPRQVWIPDTQEPSTPINAASLAANDSGNPISIFTGHGVHPDVRQAAGGTQRVSSGVMAGMLIRKVVPVYPAVGRAVRVSGRVEMQATISRTGTIENLRVVSGPAMLQQAAMDAVKQWRYRPYLLNGEPVEVETTIDVDFNLE